MKRIKIILIDLVIMLGLVLLVYGLFNLYQLRVKQTSNDNSNHAINILGK